MPTWAVSVVAILGGLLLLWAALVLVLLRVAPEPGLLGQAMRLLPDLLRLVARLARDRSLPAGVRIRLWLLLGYLALPVDLVPDVVPVLGYADDAVLTALVLRSVIRTAGPQALERHWPGTAQGLDVVRRLTGLPS